MGQWVKTLFGKISVSSDASGDSMVHIYEEFPAGSWRLYRSVLPGAELVSERAGNKLRFELPGRELISVHEAHGAYTLVFDGAKLTIKVV